MPAPLPCPAAPAPPRPARWSRPMALWLALATLLLAAPLLPGPAPFAPAAHAQERDRSGRAQAGADGGGPGVLALLPGDSTTQHELRLGDRTLAYAATAGTLPLFDQSGSRTAAVFYTSYTLKGADTAARPVTFVFNGGPGAASAYLHLGLVGPRALDLGPDGREAAGARLRDNPDTWLAFTDLVLIDPVGTGWSRTAKPDDARNFWGVRQDAGVTAKVIALWLARNGRTASPTWLLGESYGGLRAAKAARALLDEQGIATSGIVMLSPLIDSAYIFGGDQSALVAALRLPSLIAAALERRGALTPADAPAAMAEARRFALGEYLATLAGPPPEGDAARAFHARVAELTGLPPEVVARTRGFIGNAWMKRGGPGDPRLASRYDADFTVPDPFPESASPRGPDPILDGATRAYAGAFVAYAREELGFRTDMTYQLLSGEVNRRWDWHSDSGPVLGPSAEDDIRELLAIEPRFRLLVANGMTDMTTPWAVSAYVLDHLPPALAGRTSLRLYPGGHMVYLRPDTRAAFTADARALYGAQP